MANSFSDWDAGLHRSSDTDSLQHYGVLGMKWGMRRYQNKDGSLTAAGERHYEKTGEKGYHYHSHATKKYQKKAAKAEAKGNTEKAKKYKNRAKRSAELDRREQEAAKKISVGKALATRALFGGAASKAYQQYQAMAGDRKKGLSSKFFAALAALKGGTIGSRAAKAAYIRKGEKKHGAYTTVYKVGKRINEGNKIADARADRKIKDAKAAAKAALEDAINERRYQHYMNQQALKEYREKRKSKKKS